MSDVYQDLKDYFAPGERGEFRVELPKLTVFRLRQAALVESARTKTRVTWLTLLERAAAEMLNKQESK